MITTISITKYKGWKTPFGFLSMMILRIYLWFQPKPTFWKLLGCGKNGTFDINPDWSQWGLLANFDSLEEAKSFTQNSFLSKYWNSWGEETWNLYLAPFDAHGQWDGSQVFVLNKDYDASRPVGVLTRATIRLSKARDFWENVPAVARTLENTPGFITSIGIGEVPFLKQATFSIWENVEYVKKFAYRQKEHSEVIKRTRARNWYSEELFARFSILSSEGKLNGKNPLNI